MKTRRSVLFGSAGAGATGLFGAWAILSVGEGSGDGSRSTDGTDAPDDADANCTATARRHPRTDLFSIDTVTSEPGSTTVHYRINAEAVATVAIVSDGEVLKRSSRASPGRNHLAFERDGPTTFGIRLLDVDGNVLDEARIHATCTT